MLIEIVDKKENTNMKQEKIIQHLCDFVDDKKIIENEEYKKQDKEFGKCSDILEKHLNIKENKEIFKMYFNYTLEQGSLQNISNEIYFKEGFLCGARLMMEICGYSREEK